MEVVGQAAVIDCLFCALVRTMYFVNFSHKAILAQNRRPIIAMLI